MEIFFTPGPSALYFTYQDHLRSAQKEQVGSISHRSQAFQNIFAHAVEQIKETLSLPEEYHVFFMPSATECWERIGQNLITHTSHHFVHGSFGNKFYKMISEMGKNAEKTSLASTSPFIPDHSEGELIALTMNETSTGYQHDNEDLKKIRDLNPSALVALDVVSATPAIRIDYSLVDTAYFSVQKCFGLPAGLGVWIVNESAVEKAQTLDHPSYHSIPSLMKYAQKNQSPETPNVMNIYLAGNIAEDMNRRGVKAIQTETHYKAALLYQTIEQHPLLEVAISEKKHRSKTTIVANCLDTSGLKSFLKSKGMIIGGGYGGAADTQIRIANFPAHSKEQVELLCDTLMKFG